MPSQTTALRRAVLGGRRGTGAGGIGPAGRRPAEPVPTPAALAALAPAPVALAVAVGEPLSLADPLAALLAALVGSLLAAGWLTVQGQVLALGPSGGVAVVVAAEVGPRTATLAAAAQVVAGLAGVALLAWLGGAAAAAAAGIGPPLAWAAGLLALTAALGSRGARAVGPLARRAAAAAGAVVLAGAVGAAAACRGGCPAPVDPSPGAVEPGLATFAALAAVPALAGPGLAEAAPLLRRHRPATARLVGLLITPAVAAALLASGWLVALAGTAGRGAAGMMELAAVDVAQPTARAVHALVGSGLVGLSVLGLVGLTAGMMRLGGELAAASRVPRQLASRGDRLAVATPATLVALLAAAALLGVGPTGTAVGAATAGLPVAVLTGMALHRRARDPDGSSIRRLLRRLSGPAVAAVAAPLALVAALPAPLGAGGWPWLVVVAAVAATMGWLARHYARTSRRLRAESGAETVAPLPSEGVVLVDRVDEPTARALSHAQAAGIAPLRAVLAPPPGGDVRELRERLARLAPDLHVAATVPADTRGGWSAAAAGAVYRARGVSQPMTTAVIAETLSRTWGGQLRANRRELAIKARLRRTGLVAVADVTSPQGGPGPYTLEDPITHHVVALVGRLSPPTRRALGYARALRASTHQALAIDLDASRTRELVAEWRAEQPDLPLEIIEAPGQAAGEAVREWVRSLRPDGRRTVVTVVVPEVVVPSALLRPLHNRIARIVQAALLLERGVVTVSVPHRLAPASRRRGRLTAEQPAPAELPPDLPGRRAGSPRG